MKCRYDLIAIDLDGTLLCPDGRISVGNAAAIRRAREAGVGVTICTGRGLVECRAFAEQIEQRDPVVVAGGAMVSCPMNQATLHRFAMDVGLVGQLVECMVSHGHAALVLKDPDGTRRTGSGAVESAVAGDEAGGTEGPAREDGDGRGDGHDYLVVSPRGWDGIDPITRWWFKTLDVPVRVVERLEDDEHPECSVRVGVCGTLRATRSVAAGVRANFADRTTLHHFQAVVPGTHPETEDDHILILEAFGKDVNKWTAIRWLAEQRGLDTGRIAAIGNDINDVTMLRAAGLGVAMGNSVPQALEAAQRQTRGNDADGVAHAVEMILSGEW